MIDLFVVLPAREGVPVAAPEAVTRSLPLIWTVGHVRVYAAMDATYRFRVYPQGLLIHDGRIDGWEDEPQRWNGSFLALSLQRFDDLMGLRLVTDRLGLVPAYGAADGHAVYVGSKLTRLASVGFASLDPVAAWQLVLFDQPLWERTLLAGVRLLPPASVIQVRPDGTFPARAYWTVPEAATAETRGEAQLVDELIQRLRVAHARALQGTSAVVFPVTGGLDSRINLAVHASRLDESALLFHCLNPGTPESWSVRAMERALGRSIRYFSEAAGIVAIPSGRPDWETGELNSAQFWLDHAIAAVAAMAPGATLVDGYIQDVVFNPHVVSASEHPATSEVALRRARWRYRLLGRDPADGVFPSLCDEFMERYRMPGSALHASQRYYLTNRSRRYVAGCVRLAQNRLRVATPGIDRDVLAFGFGLPVAARFGGSVYRKAIGQLSPALGAVPYDKTGLPLSAHADRLSLRLRAYRFGQRWVRRMWPGRLPFAGPPGDVDTLLRNDPGFRARIESLLCGSAWVSQMMGGAMVSGELLHLQARGRDVGSLILALLTLAKLESALATPSASHAGDASMELGRRASHA
jgi:hypothetical protein